MTAQNRASTRRRIRTSVARLAAYILLGALAIVFLAPLAMLVITSFKTLPEFTRDALSLPASISTENFVEAWNAADFGRYVGNTALYTAVSTVVFVITATFLAMAIARRLVRGSGALLTLFLVALFLPSAMVPQFQLILRLGLHGSPIGYVMLLLVNPIGIVILVNAIRSVPRDLDDAAALEGVGYIRYVLRIVVPLIMPAIAAVAVLHALGVWNELILATIYLTQPGDFSIARALIAFSDTGASNWPVLAAAVLMIAAPMAVFFVVMQRYIIRGVIAGAPEG